MGVDLASSEWAQVSFRQKPVIMGEFVSTHAICTQCL